MRCGSAWLLGLAGGTLSNALVLEKRNSPAVFEVPLIKEDISHQITKRSDFLNINFTDKVSDVSLELDCHPGIRLKLTLLLSSMPIMPISHSAVRLRPSRRIYRHTVMDVG